MKLGRWGWGFCAALAVLVGVVVAGPAAAEPTLEATIEDLPVDGDLIAVHIDGSAGYEGAQRMTISACGNSSGGELFLTDPGFSCGGGITYEYVENGDTFSGVGAILGPVDGMDYDVVLEWAEYYNNDCIDGAPLACVVRIAGWSSVPGIPIWEVTVEFTEIVPLPRVSIGNVSIIEGDDGLTDFSIPVELSRSVEWNVVVRPRLHGVETNVDQWSYPVVNPLDLQLNDYSLDMLAGETSGELNFRVHGDTLDEIDERAIVDIRDIYNAAPGGFYGLSLITVLDDDLPPTLVPGQATTLEGDAGSTFVEVPFVLDAVSSHDVEFDYVMGANPAQAGVDYVASTGHVVIPAGQTTAHVSVEILGDTVPEDDEIVLVGARNIVNARPGGFWGLAFVHILNDEPFPDCLDRLLPGANLSWCDLSGQTFVGLDLHGADLRSADLRGTAFVDSDLSDVDATGALVGGAFLARTDLSDAALTGDGTTTFVQSNLDGATLTGEFTGSVWVAGSAQGAAFEGEFGDTAFTLVDMVGADLDYGWFPRAVWARSACPDGASSETTFDTCLRMRIEVWDPAAGMSKILLDAPEGTQYFPKTHLTVDLFGGPRLNPGLWYWDGSVYRFGPTGTESEITSGWELTWFIDDDPWYDSGWTVLRADAGFSVGDERACISGVTSDDQRVWGCVPVTVTQYEAPHMSPPASPPTSPPTSPPLSGSALLDGLVPLLQAPIGLMATASAIGMVFLLGSSRAGRLLQEGREDGEGEDDLDEPVERT